MKAFKKEIYWQCDLMAINKSNVACVHRRNISQYDSGERCGPWASCFVYVGWLGGGGSSYFEILMLLLFCKVPSQYEGIYMD
jgi:hypothetical protein